MGAAASALRAVKVSSQIKMRLYNCTTVARYGHSHCTIFGQRLTYCCRCSGLPGEVFVGHDQESPAASSLVIRAGRAKPADGIFVNPADRPVGPGGQSCAVAAPIRKQLLAGRPGPCRIRRSGDIHSERGPGLLHPGQNMQGQNIQALGAMRTEFAGVTTARELWPDVWWVLA